MFAAVGNLSRKAIVPLGAVREFACSSLASKPSNLGIPVVVAPGSICQGGSPQVGAGALTPPTAPPAVSLGVLEPGTCTVAGRRPR